VTIDSVRGAVYFGRLSHYFSGNVGHDPEGFETFSDSIRPGDSLTFFILSKDARLPGMTLSGVLASDTIELEELALGPDTIVSGPYRWMLVRRH
jgi:hypothetical protein